MDEKMVRKIDDAELDDIVGGRGAGVVNVDNNLDNSSRIPFACRKSSCGQTFFIKMGQSDVVCPKCHSKYHIDG